MASINKISFKGKRVLIRVDFNVPLNTQFEITDDTRMVAALPTIKKVISDGGRAIVLSHLGRPKNGFEKKFSLKHLVNHLKVLLDTDVSFSADCIGGQANSSVGKMKNGDVLLLENLRFYPQEKAGDINFAKKLSSLGDVYINDAFGSAHRAHASTSIITKFFPKNKFFGFLFNDEVVSLEKALKSPKRPFTAIIGGAKISGKIDVIKSLFNRVDNLIVGGGMAYTFAKALGGNIGKSLVELEKIGLAKNLIDESKKSSTNLFLPTDSLNACGFKNDAKVNTSNILSVDPNYIGMDIGPNSIDQFAKIIRNSKTILWNGPMGVFEMKKFQNGTKKIGEAICFATNKGAFSLVGGGDSVAATKMFNFEDKVSYLSTGGGAMLEYLEGKSLPGIAAIQS